MKYTKLAKKLRKEADNLRFEVSSFEEFFEKYIGLVNTVEDVEATYSLGPRTFKMHRATHDTPIGYRCNWTKEDREDPSIPNQHKIVEYLVHYDLTVQAEGVKKEVLLDLFSGSHLFWAFGDIKPNYVRCNISASSDKSFKVYLFIEDFPKIFRMQRKEMAIEQIQDKYTESVKMFNKALKQYQRDIIDQDSELKEISTIKGDLNRMLEEIASIEHDRKDYIIASSPKEFMENNPIPEPEDIFVSTENFEFPEPGDASEITRRFISLKEEYEQYKKDNPMDLI